MFTSSVDLANEYHQNLLAQSEKARSLQKAKSQRPRLPNRLLLITADTLIAMGQKLKTRANMQVSINIY